MAKKVTRMVLKVDLSSPCCSEKVKNSLYEFTDEITEPMYDKRANLVKITVECCCPERFCVKLCGIDRKVIQSIESPEPPQPGFEKPTKPASPATAPAAKLTASEPNSPVAPDPTPPNTSSTATAPAAKLTASEPNPPVAPDPTPPKKSSPATAQAAELSGTEPNPSVAPVPTPPNTSSPATAPAANLAETEPNPQLAPEPTPPKTSSSATAQAAELTATKPNPQVAPDPTPRVAKPTKPADPPKIPSPATAPAVKPRTIPDDTTHNQGSFYYLSNFGLTDQKEDLEDAIGEQDEQAGNPYSAIQSQVITLKGEIKDKIVTIVIDTGSDFSLISSEKADVLNLTTEEIQPLEVILGDKSKATSSAICKRVELKLQRYPFEYDLRVMDIAEDIILGVDWMRSIGLILFDYKQSKIFLFDVNGIIELTGDTDHTNVKLISGGENSEVFKFEQAANRAHDGKAAGDTTAYGSFEGSIGSSLTNSANDEANGTKGNLVCQHCWAKFNAHDTNGGDKFEFLLISKYCNTCYKKFVGAEASGH